MLYNHIQSNPTPETVFNNFIDFIETGRIYLGHQKSAMHMAERWNFLIQRVEDAILTGYQNKFNGYVGQIAIGATQLEKPARSLLEQVTFKDPEAALGQLEDALEKGNVELQNMYN